MYLAAFDRGARGLDHGPGFLFPLFLITVAALGFVWLRRRRHGAMHERFATAGPKQTLADRFARGEINQQEYAHRRAVLDGEELIPPAPGDPAPPSSPDAGTTPSDTSDEAHDGLGEESDE